MYENWKVYVHVNKVNGKKYFGITSRSLEKRFGSNGRNYTQKNKGTKTYFELAINKYGWNGFEHILLFENLNKIEACSLEKIFISFYKSNDRKHGYNMTGGGEGSLGLHPSEETRKKIGMATRNASKETHEKWSYVRRKENWTEEHRKNYERGMANKTTGFLKGSKHTAESKLKMRLNTSSRRPLMCLNTMEIFQFSDEAEKYTDVKRCNIRHCANGINHYAGRHLVTGEKLHWIYVDKYNKLSQSEKEDLKDQFYTGSFLMPEKERDIYE